MDRRNALKMMGAALASVAMAGIAPKTHAAILKDRCVECMTCEKVCPHKNFRLGNEGLEFSGKCEYCLSCVHNCPQKALTLRSAREGWPGERNPEARYRNPSISLNDNSIQQTVPMKKFVILAAATLMCLTACAQNNKKMNENKTLIAWFSWSGNTEAVVNHIAEVTGADTFRIEREKPYPEQYDPCTVDAKNEVDNHVFPAIKGLPENFEQYKTVIVAVPVWWYTAPMPVRTFLEKSGLDWSGKTVIPLCTAYTAEYNTLKDIMKATPDAEHLEGLAVITTKMNGEDIDKKFPQVDAWLQKTGLMK